MAESEELLHLRRRARRRLLGATALLLFLVIVPPMLMDLEPRPVSTNVSVEIPPRDTRLPAKTESKAEGKAVTAPVTPAPTPAPAEAARTPTAATQSEVAPSGVPRSAGTRPQAAPETTAKAPAESTPPAPPPAENVKAAPKEDPPKVAQKEDSKAADGKETYFVQLGVFSKADRAQEVRGKVSEAGIRIYAEQVKGESGEQTRLRAGPFTSKDAAEKAKARLDELGKSLGFKPGPVRANEKRA